jgi:1,6-anhydro-N-acetylmuramate kinase
MDGKSRLIAGAMSGTSADGVDVALVRVEGRGLQMSVCLLHEHHRAYPAQLRESIGKIRRDGAAPLAVLAEMGREISLCHAAAVNEALLAANFGAGLWMRWRRMGRRFFMSRRCTIQWLDPALVAAETWGRWW